MKLYGHREWNLTGMDLVSNLKHSEDSTKSINF